MSATNRVYTGFPVVVTEPADVDTTEYEYLDTALPGTLVASKVAIYNSSKQLAMARQIVDDGAAVILTANQSGALCVFNKTDGAQFTLPACAAGLWFDFIVTASVTSGAYKVITSAGTEFLLGMLISVDTDTSNALAYNQTGNGSTHVSINMDSASSNAKGGLVNTNFRLVCYSATQWLVSGMNFGAGTVASPFATS